MSVSQPPPATESRALLPASLIIATRNRPDFVVATVEAVLDGDKLPGEIVIVDHSDFPNDRIPGMATAPVKLRYLWERSRGLSKGRNMGIRASTYDALIFTDDDVLPTRGWLNALFTALTEVGNGGVVAGAVVHGPPEGHGNFATALVEGAGRRTYVGRQAEPNIGSINFAAHRPALYTVGLFDERLGPGTAFPAAEDNDLAFRLLEAGYEITHVPNAVVVHRAWRRPDSYRGMRWRYGFGQGAFYAKHAHLSDSYTARLMAQNILRHVSQAKARWPRDRRLAYGDVAYTCGLVAGALRWLLLPKRKA